MSNTGPSQPSELELSTLQLTLQPSNVPWTRQQIRTRATYKSAKLQKNHKSHSSPISNNASPIYFPAMKSISASVPCVTVWTDTGKGAGSRVQTSVADVGSVSWQGTEVERSQAWRRCRRMCWVREEEQGASSSRQIACLCGSQHPYIAFLVSPTPPPRLVFHPCPSGCNGVPGCLDGWRRGHYWQPVLKRHSFLSWSSKTWVIATYPTGAPLYVCPSSSPLHVYNFSLALFSFLSLSLPCCCTLQIVYSFSCFLSFPTLPFLPFQHSRLVVPDPFHLEMWHASVGCIWGCRGFRKLLHTYSYEHTVAYTLSFSVKLAHRILLLEMPASWGNYSALSLDSSWNSTSSVDWMYSSQPWPCQHFITMFFSW